MFVAAAVLERRGPFAALRRSNELINGHVFRVLAIFSVSSLIVGVLVYVPQALIAIPLAISTGQIDYGAARPRRSSAGGARCAQILFESVGAIVYTLMFIDLRNRREGTDMAERLTQLEASPMVTVPHVLPK